MANARSNQSTTRDSGRTAFGCAWRLAGMLAVAQLSAACIAVGSDPRRGPPDGGVEASVDDVAFGQAVAQAVAACGEGQVESVRAAAVRGPDGRSAPTETDFVCRGGAAKFDRDAVKRLAIQTCGAGNVAVTSMQYGSSGALRSVGFRCGREAP